MTIVTQDGDEIEVYDGHSVGNGMKGLYVNGGLQSWDTNPKDGWPHHDDVDEDGVRQLQLSNYTSRFNEIAVSGFAPPLQYASDVLNFFSEYKPDTNIHVDLGLRGTNIDFSFRGTVAQFKSYLKHNPPPVAEDYEDGERDDEFMDDYEAWTKTFEDVKTVRDILRRGGRDDVWQERDEDMSKSFSVYNNPPRLLYHSSSKSKRESIKKRTFGE